MVACTQLCRATRAPSAIRLLSSIPKSRPCAHSCRPAASPTAFRFRTMTRCYGSSMPRRRRCARLGVTLGLRELRCDRSPARHRDCAQNRRLGVGSANSVTLYDNSVPRAMAAQSFGVPPMAPHSPFPSFRFRRQRHELCFVDPLHNQFTACRGHASRLRMASTRTVRHCGSENPCSSPDSVNEAGRRDGRPRSFSCLPNRFSKGRV